MHKRAKYIVEILRDNGYIAYYAGGWVRDYLLGMDSDDIDIATNASPDIIEKLFKHTIPIGKSFGIILVIIGEHSYEVATFRKDISYKDGRRPDKIEFTTPIEDAKRRDFTINGMFFDPIKKEVIDFVEGKKDLEKQIIKSIGDPHERIKEDRLRMVRAIRLSIRFDFQIDEALKKAIIFHSSELLKYVAIERIYQEIYKMSKYKNFKKGIISFYDYNILQNIFPFLKIERSLLEDRLKYLEYIPNNAPVIVKILELFPDYSLEEKISLCKYLKLPNKDINFVTYYDRVEKNQNVSDYELAYLYSNRYSDIVLKIIAVHLSLKDKKSFLKKYEEKKKELFFFIERIKKRDPVVKAFHLKKEGIEPGPFMGYLLKEAEKISINEKIEDENIIISKLRKRF